MRIYLLILVALCFFAGSMAAFATDEKVVEVQTPRGISQPFRFIAPDNPKAGVILFIGHTGVLEDNKDALLVRNARKLAEGNLMVALVDHPSDKVEINAKFRISKKHAGDMIAVMNYMTNQAGVPIWLVGSSTGTLSAASVAIKKQKRISGMVLLSAVTRSSADWAIADRFPKGVASMPLKKIKVPVLIVSHAKDKCENTLPAGASELKRKLSNASQVEIVTLEGGSPIKHGPCDKFSHHGFYGIEDQAIGHIAKFISQ